MTDVCELWKVGGPLGSQTNLVHTNQILLAEKLSRLQHPMISLMHSPTLYSTVAYYYSGDSPASDVPHWQH